MPKCATSYCKHDTKGRTYCATCRSRQARKRNVMKYCYNNLKSNAAKRGKELTLTFSEFVQFCTETNYIQGKGKTRTSFSIDRKENEKGYTKDNIRVLPLGENASKGTKKLEYDYRSGYATVINYNQEIYTNVDNYF